MTEKIIREFLSDNFFIDGVPSGESLTQGGTLDSMGVLELIMFLEERFNLTIPDEEVIPENLDSVEKIVRYVDSRSG